MVLLITLANDAKLAKLGTSGSRIDRGSRACWSFEAMGLYVGEIIERLKYFLPTTRE